MTFKELELLIAIEQVGEYGRDRFGAERLEYAIAVQRWYSLLHGDTVFPFSAEDVNRWAVALRKQKATQIKAAIAAAHGCRCFWDRRNKGPCSEDAEGGHMVAESAGEELSVANGMVECGAHNRLRSAMTIEEFFLSDKTT